MRRSRRRAAQHRAARLDRRGRRPRVPAELVADDLGAQPRDVPPGLVQVLERAGELEPARLDPTERAGGVVDVEAVVEYERLLLVGQLVQVAPGGLDGPVDQARGLVDGE